jgi:hypothetical protein
VAVQKRNPGTAAVADSARNHKPTSPSRAHQAEQDQHCGSRGTEVRQRRADYSICTPHPISDAAASGEPSALFSGTKNPLAHKPLAADNTN